MPSIAWAYYWRLQKIYITGKSSWVLHSTKYWTKLTDLNKRTARIILYTLSVVCAVTPPILWNEWRTRKTGAHGRPSLCDSTHNFAKLVNTTPVMESKLLNLQLQWEPSAMATAPQPVHIKWTRHLIYSIPLLPLSWLPHKRSSAVNKAWKSGSANADHKHCLPVEGMLLTYSCMVAALAERPTKATPLSFRQTCIQKVQQHMRDNGKHNLQ